MVTGIFPHLPAVKRTLQIFKYSRPTVQYSTVGLQQSLINILKLSSLFLFQRFLPLSFVFRRDSKRHLTSTASSDSTTVCTFSATSQTLFVSTNAATTTHFPFNVRSFYS